jgi:hypothetical protein
LESLSAKICGEICEICGKKTYYNFNNSVV